MSAPLHLGPQRLGTTLAYRVDLASALGSDVTLTGSETIAAAIWPVGGGDALASPAVVVDSGDGVFEVDADPETFLAAVYRVGFTVDGMPAFPADAFITFLPGAATGEALGGSPKQAITGTSPYCTVADFLAFYDERHVGQLVNDSGTQTSASGLEFSTKLERILMGASGELEAAIQTGRRYAVADLRVLAASGSNGAAFLAELVADLAMARLRRRRGLPEELTPAELAAKATIEQLRGGAKILPFDQSAGAGLPSSVVLTEEDRRGQNLVSGNVRYFGRRQSYYRDGY